MFLTGRNFVCCYFVSKNIFAAFSYVLFFQHTKSQNVRRKKNNISCLFFPYAPWDSFLFFLHLRGLVHQYSWKLFLTSVPPEGICFLRNLSHFFLVISSLMHCNFFLPKGIIGFAPTLSSYGIPKRSLESLACSLHLVCSYKDNRRYSLTPLPHNCLNYFYPTLSGGIEKHSQYGIWELYFLLAELPVKDTVCSVFSNICSIITYLSFHQKERDNLKFSNLLRNNPYFWGLCLIALCILLLPFALSLLSNLVLYSNWTVSL